jgi:hypothetical protein
MMNKMNKHTYRLARCFVFSLIGLVTVLSILQSVGWVSQRVFGFIVLPFSIIGGAIVLIKDWRENED